MNRAPLSALLAATVSLLAACSDAGSPATPAQRPVPAQDESPPLRIVRFSPISQSAEYIVQLEGLVAGCRLQHGLPPAAFTPPSLADIHLLEEEELFDGPRHAVYTMIARVAPDAARGCELALWMERSVSIETSCGPRLHGTSTPIRELLFDHRPASVHWEQDPPPEGGCDTRQTPEASESVPREQLPGGASCVWSSALTALAVNSSAAPAPGPSPDATDVCFHARRPVHRYSDASGMPIPVVLRSHAPRTKPALQALGLPRDTMAQELASLTEGVPIAPARFTQAGAQSFLNQPPRRSLGPARP